VADFMRFEFDDGTAVLMEAFTTAELGGLVSAGGGRGGGDAGALDLPVGAAPLEPVSRVQDTLAKAGNSLAESLRPLVPVLESVHRTVLKAARPPDRVSVELGLKLTSEMHLMIVGANGEASLTVRADWDLHRDLEGSGPLAPAERAE
jgi:hypothetical protein